MEAELTARKISEVNIKNHPLPDGRSQNFDLTYQGFGLPLGEAPVVVINHPLTGNSQITGRNGWWNTMVGSGKVIDLNRYTVLAFNVPGNGFGQRQPRYYPELTTKVVAELYWKALCQLGVNRLFAVIGGSLGGSLAWEMAFLRPKAINHLIPIACCLQSSDWLIGNVLTQERILNNSVRPIEDARRHAMLLYRTPASFKIKFNRERSKTEFAVESWLNHHGNSLQNRFSLPAYKTANHLLKTVGESINTAAINEFARTVSGKITCVAIDRDYLFTKEEQYQTYQLIRQYHPKTVFREIRSVHGHDAFLIEFEQLKLILKPIFQ